MLKRHRLLSAPLAVLVVLGLAAQAPTAGATVTGQVGTGHTAHAGTVTFPTSQVGATYWLRYPGQSDLVCQRYKTGKAYSGTDNLWGNGSRFDLETACADAFYAVDQERHMLADWLGRDGMDGKGGWVPIRMGLPEEDAYYDGDAREVLIGHERSGAWLSQIDAVAHEFGHGIDDHTGGGFSDDTTAEFIADAFGAATEFYADNPFDTPDYLVGEEGDEVIRSMSDPEEYDAPGCYKKAEIARTETHDAAGVGNHWFYLVAEGSDPADGQPESPTCNGKTVTGIGIERAIQVLYRGMLRKRASTSYPRYRRWTLTAAKEMDPSCVTFHTVKKAWNAVRVPAKRGEPGCAATGSLVSR